MEGPVCDPSMFLTPEKEEEGCSSPHKIQYTRKTNTVDKRLKYLISPEMLTAVVYSGLNSHYNEPKAFLLNRQRPGEQSLFPTNPGDCYYCKRISQ